MSLCLHRDRLRAEPGESRSALVELEALPSLLTSTSYVLVALSTVTSQRNIHVSPRGVTMKLVTSDGVAAAV